MLNRRLGGKVAQNSLYIWLALAVPEKTIITVDVFISLCKPSSKSAHGLLMQRLQFLKGCVLDVAVLNPAVEFELPLQEICLLQERVALL